MKADNIVLVGFMGTGKSTVGRLLASKLGYEYVDTDQLIESEQGISIAELFKLHGEPYFREVESSVLRKVVSRSGQVVATGGGAVLAEHNREAMLSGGYVVALSASKEAIIARVKGDRARPLLQGDLEQRVEKLLTDRKNAYDFADFMMDTSELSADEAAELIVMKKKEAGY